MTPEDVESLPVMDLGFGELRERLNAAVISGEKTACTSLHRSYAIEGEALPEPGLQKLIDQHGAAVGVIDVVSVEVRRIADIDLEIARAEGEGDATVLAWRTGHEEYWRATGEISAPLDDDELIVVERFRWLPESGPK